MKKILIEIDERQYAAILAWREQWKADTGKGISTSGALRVMIKHATGVEPLPKVKRVPEVDGWRPARVPAWVQAAEAAPPALPAGVDPIAAQLQPGESITVVRRGVVQKLQSPQAPVNP